MAGQKKIKKRVSQRYLCRECGTVQLRWMGKCPDCNTWDSLEAMPESPVDRDDLAPDPHAGVADIWRQAITAAGSGGGGGPGGPGAPPAPLPVGQVSTESASERWSAGSDEFDRVLGGGFVPGSAVLIGGEPGIGKSTLLLQAAAHLAGVGHTVLYVSSEESMAQLRRRADRLGLSERAGRSLFVLSETNLIRICRHAAMSRPTMLVVDSIQMVYRPDVEAAPGSVTQMRACAADLIHLAKLSGMAVVLIGHVTKEGRLAGPRLLEHLVDAVLYFEGDDQHAHRVVRAVKNRFGTTLEIGLFEMTGQGLAELTNPAIACHGSDDDQNVLRAGTILFPTLQGSRCFLVELQALTCTGILGAAKRRVSGLDSNRLAVLIAVLEKRAGLRLADQDVFVASAGGFRVMEPAADLAIALAVAGSHMNRALTADCIAIGEVGLDGRLRTVPQMDQRLREAARLGYRQAIVPLDVAGGKGRRAPQGGQPLTVLAARTLDHALSHMEPCLPASAATPVVKRRTSASQSRSF